MTSTPGRRPTTDAELVRDLHDRLRKLELSPTLRAGPWVLANDPATGALRAMRPGQTVVIDGETVTEIAPADIDLSGLVTSAQLKELLSGLGRESIWSELYKRLTGLLSPVDALAALSEFFKAELAKTTEIIDAAWEAIFNDQGAVDKTAADLAHALRNIPGVNIVGVGAATMVDTVTDILDNVWRGLARSGGGGKSVADVANAATNTATAADTALQVGEWNNAVLGLRNNKSLMEGIDETEEANYSLQTLWGIGTEPVAAYAVSSASSPVAYWRATETAHKGFISWFGRGFTDVTELFVDVYRADYSTNTWELIHTSTNLVGMATAAWQYLVYNLPEDDRFEVHSGDVIGVAWRVTGTGTHSVAGITITGQPEHPTVHPKRPVSARSGVGDLSFASTSYTANTLPWFGIGIVEGDTPPPYFAPRTVELSTPGVHDIPIEPWANMVDVILNGGGGGGAGGNPIAFLNGEGGGAGEWEAETLVRGVDFPVNATHISVLVGLGGTAGNVNDQGGVGGNTVRLAITGGKDALTASGGARGDQQQSGSDSGDSPGSFIYQGVTYVGGNGGSAVGGRRGGPGTGPGGGGGGGSGGTWGVAYDGGPGARGGAWAVMRQD